MFYYLSQLDLGESYSWLNVFRYITFRTGGAILTALLFSFLFGPRLIDSFRVRQGKGQPIRDDGPKTHLAKQGTPTMGGILILSSWTFAALLWADLSNPYVWVVTAVTLTYGMIGFYDDYLKVSKQDTDGFPGKLRLLLEVGIAAFAVYLVTWLGNKPFNTSLAFPFFKDLLLDLGPFYILFGAIVIVGAGNAVNLTDGLDGLAIVPVMIAGGTFGIITYLVGHAVFSEYLQITFVPRTGELAVLCGAIVGAGLGFLWYNAPPAMIFMGDTGSLALGGMLGTLAVCIKHEIVLGIVGGLFVVEALSVIIQVASYKLTGKRVFRMAPIHHHYEEKGWSESTVVIRFWIVAFLLALISLTTLKLR